jgi:hypothetical protein
VLAEEFPDIAFVTTTTSAEVAREIADAGLLIVHSSAYTRPVAAVKDNARRWKWIQFTTSSIDIELRHETSGLRHRCRAATLSTRWV